MSKTLRLRRLVIGWAWTRPIWAIRVSYPSQSSVRWSVHLGLLLIMWTTPRWTPL